MRTQRESKAVWWLAGVSIFVLFFIVCCRDGIATEPDFVFLYNRCFQMWDCFRNGYYPFLYYNDIGGIGYGSPIFYGQLTLVPFIPFLASISTFVKIYYLCCLLLNFFGFRSFVKRFSCYGTLSACFYILGLPFMQLYLSVLPANVLALGFGWFFFAYCVDFFRDGTGFYSLILTYFLIWQSNFNATILSTLVCFALFCVWFDRRRIKDYVRLFLFVFLLVSYNLVNMFVHRDSLVLVGYDTLFGHGNFEDAWSLLSPVPFGGFIFRLVRMALFGGDRCCGLTTSGVAAVFVVSLFRGYRFESRRYKICSCIVICSVFVGYVLGLCYVWPELFRLTGIFIQFPIRYMVVIWGFLVLVLSRCIKPSKAVYIVLALAVLDVLVASPNPSPIGAGGVDKAPQYFQLGFGEYTGETFIQRVDVYEEYSSFVHSASGVTYEFTNEYNGVSVDCSGNTGGDVITLPKLYYNGYVAYGEGSETFAVRGGYSNYCEVVVGDYTGVLRLEYRVPFAVLLLFYLQIFMLARVLYCLSRPYIKRWRSSV